jgi:REP element-mobilizing transposase RayT
MLTYPRRLHIKHSERPGGICHVTWRLHRNQAALTPEERSIAFGVLKRAPEFGCIWRAGVIMDDHVHALFEPGELRTSQRFVLSWKGASGRLIKDHSGRRSPIWQAEYYQRWISSPALIPICVEYIRNNPRRKWPGIQKYEWVLP